MTYFNFFVYFIIAHVALTFVYRGYVYYLYKKYGITFNQHSIFFSIKTKEIKDKIACYKQKTEEKKLLQLYSLHKILSASGKVIILNLILLILLYFYLFIKQQYF